MSTLVLFFIVSLASTAMPGPAILYVCTQGMSGGLRAGLPAAAGVLCADALYIVLSVTGLSAVLAASYELFTLMKWAGAVYLCYLGLRLIFSAIGQTSPATPAGAPIAARRSLLGGFVLHAANPKALLYFGSLVPQFVDPARPLPSQLVTLAAIHLSTAAVVLIAYAAVSARLRYSAANAGANRIFKVAAGSSMVGAGVSMALLRKGTE
jgi:homoserine/homoserine lactone efflux protein